MNEELIDMFLANLKTKMMTADSTLTVDIAYGHNTTVDANGDLVLEHDGTFCVTVKGSQS